MTKHSDTRARRRWVAAALAGTCGATLALAPSGAAAAPAPDEAGNAKQLAQPSLRSPLTRERIYSLMTDRFENGDPTNDDQASSEAVNEYDPTHKGFYHGGDLKGLTSRLDYIKELGQTAIWITPPMYNDWLFEGKLPTGETNTTASYHGYWITKFDQVDPHVGTAEDLKELVRQAHARGMKVFFDIVVNHTGDVISYEEGEQQPYRSKTDQPYKDADGKEFDDRDYETAAVFPKLDPETSFPYNPTFRTEADKSVKSPAWLNDPTMYHNRGETTFQGENSLYGDFFGLDDVFTERPEVVAGMTKIFQDWITQYNIDGYRIDTTRHVNMAFWQQFITGVLDYARANGRPDFYMFGEAAVEDPVELSAYTSEGKYQSVLDFTFQDNARNFASKSASAADLATFFQTDDMYTDSDSNAYQLPTFVDNHDRGRIGWMIQADNPGIANSETLRRSQLAHELMYFARGNPVVYYGDEQGFTGDGNDQDAREDMFPSKVSSYNDNDLLGTDATTATSNFDQNHPMYRYLQRLNQLTAEHPALRDGAQIHRYADNGPGVYAFSRIDRDEKVEYVVALNNSEAEKTASVATYSPNAPFVRLYPTPDGTHNTDAGGKLTVTVPPLSAVVYRAAVPLADVNGGKAAATTLDLAQGGKINGRPFVRATVHGQGFHEVSFAVKVGKNGKWTHVGTDDNPDYKVLYDTKGLADGTEVTFQAITTDSSGRVSVSDKVVHTVDRTAPAPNVFEQP
ncbi:alpha-amylase family glycosyl hydrolase [Actinokineospora xionganensis]|uniref:Alpha amylase C-terminal domain-containing protein n=1 Tax=Actinokineospora xionganensis TaxID=2684470 RepID=A0ABR7L7P1_9PSEU|nr:alpha-amylase family glycosyl hydrolase [Actinokineospora xionganensis]MBC6448659.1 alpha amylase C-terminal domain-containing protein [Actinokineospora xionganensis]